jgi:hypothetical protein
MPRKRTLGSHDKEAPMPNEIDPGKLKQLTDEMITAISHPAFVAAMNKMKKTPMDQRLSVASKILTPAALKAKGVPLPEGMRISSRYFEPGIPTVIKIDELGARVARHDPGPVAAWGCACGGAATVCGGAGGGS